MTLINNCNCAINKNTERATKNVTHCLLVRDGAPDTANVACEWDVSKVTTKGRRWLSRATCTLQGVFFRFLYYTYKLHAHKVRGICVRILLILLDCKKACSCNLQHILMLFDYTICVYSRNAN